MNHGRKKVVAAVGFVGISLLAPAALADMALVSLPREVAAFAEPVRVKLAADRMYGFAPMMVNLSGMVQTKGGDLIPVNGGQQVRVVVESPLLVAQSSGIVTQIVSGLHYEAVSDGPVTPSVFRRAFEIRRPGRYTFRVQVISPDGQILSSNEVDVKAL